MDINYVLAAHGVVGKRSGSESIAYESVNNLASKSIENGTKILVTWKNPTQAEFVKTELFASESDLTNVDYATCVASYTKVVNGTLASYEKVAVHGATYHFKAFVTYFTFGENKVSKGVTTFATAVDTTPPSPITDFKVANGDGKVSLSWTNPTDMDFNKVKIVYKTDSYPTSATDGIVAYEGSGSSVTVTGLANESEYFFRAFTFDTFLNINNNDLQKIIGKPFPIRIYGVKIDTTNTNPETAVTYTDNAIGMVGGSAAWDNVYPFNQIRPVLFLDGAVNYELQKNDFTKRLGGAASDITSGTDGDVMIEFPKIWWKFETVGADLYVKYANIQIDSGWKCLAHTKAGTEKDKVYIGAYLGHALSTKLYSLSGKTPTGTQSLTTFRNYAQAKGVGYQLIEYYQLLMLQILYLLRYKNLNAQSALGRGFVDGNASGATTGGTNVKGMFFGETIGKSQMKFCGIEDFWGNLRYWIDGLNTDASRNILIRDINYGQGSPTDVSGYIGSVQGGTETGFIIKTSSGSATTKFTDSGTLNYSSYPFFGGYFSQGDISGAFCLSVNNNLTYSHHSVSARLAYI